MLQTVVQQAIEAQFTQFFGAAPYERSEARQWLRNGSSSRWLVTRVGKIGIRLPRDHGGGVQSDPLRALSAPRASAIQHARGVLPAGGLDANYERIRREGQVLSTAVLWVLGVAANGYRDYLGVWLGNEESGPVWSRVFKDLHARGLKGVPYIVSGEHTGLKAAVQRYFPEAVHQRCQV
jgi:putative transposase